MLCAKTGRRLFKRTANKKDAQAECGLACLYVYQRLLLLVIDTEGYLAYEGTEENIFRTAGSRAGRGYGLNQRNR